MEAWARIANIPFQLVRCMPIGELNDAITVYQILNGYAEEDNGKTLTNDYIPNLK